MIPNVDLCICFKWVGEPTTNQLCSLGLLGALRGSFPRTPGLEDVESSTHQGPEILPNLTTLVVSDIQRSKKHKCPKVAGLVKSSDCQKVIPEISHLLKTNMTLEYCSIKMHRLKWWIYKWWTCNIRIARRWFHCNGELEIIRLDIWCSRHGSEVTETTIVLAETNTGKRICIKVCSSKEGTCAFLNVVVFDSNLLSHNYFLPFDWVWLFGCVEQYFLVASIDWCRFHWIEIWITFLRVVNYWSNRSSSRPLPVSMFVCFANTFSLTMRGTMAKHTHWVSRLQTFFFLAKTFEEPSVSSCRFYMFESMHLTVTEILAISPSKAIPMRNQKDYLTKVL